MTYEKFHQTVMSELDRVFADRPHGVIARTQREMGVNSEYFRQWRRGAGRIHIPRLLEALEILNVDAAEFFRNAFSKTTDLSSGQSIQVVTPECMEAVEILRARFEGEGL